MEEIKINEKLDAFQMYEDNQEKYRTIIDAINLIPKDIDNLAFESIAALTVADGYPKLNDNLAFGRMVVTVADGYPKLNDNLAFGRMAVTVAGKENDYSSILGNYDYSSLVTKGNDFLSISEIGSMEALRVGSPLNDYTSILGKYDYSSLVTKGNDFLSITEKGYNFGSLQTVNYLLGDVATSAIQTVNGKFDNYSLANVATQLTKDLVSIDLKVVNKAKSNFLKFREKLKKEAQSLIDEFSDYFKYHSQFLPKNAEAFIEFWFDYNYECVGLSFNDLHDFKIHENDLLIYHHCKEIKLNLRLETINEAFEIVWKEFDKRGKKLITLSSAIPLLESKIPATEKKEKPLLEIINEIPD